MWVSDRRYLLLDTPMRVLSESAEAGELVNYLLGGFSGSHRAARPADTYQIVTRSSAPEEYQLLRDCQRLVASSDLPVLAAHLVADMNRRAVQACNSFACHAGAVAFGPRVVAFPAASGGGKSTLVAACLLEGAAYLSDEALVISDDGTPLPYPKPLALSPASCELLHLEPREPERLLTAEELGGSIWEGRGRLTDVVIASYGETGPSLEPLPRSQAASALLSSSFNHYKDPSRAFALATEIARAVDAWRLRYDQPQEAARLLKRVLDGR